MKKDNENVIETTLKEATKDFKKIFDKIIKDGEHYIVNDEDGESVVMLPADDFYSLLDILATQFSDILEEDDDDFLNKESKFNDFLNAITFNSETFTDYVLSNDLDFDVIDEFLEENINVEQMVEAILDYNGNLELLPVIKAEIKFSEQFDALDDDLMELIFDKVPNDDLLFKYFNNEITREEFVSMLNTLPDVNIEPSHLH
ncbi:hypothetical protein H9L01_01785 [Erysipelothrix inopinata]|uniref:Uncharacterized protein n=1 Tax=Erysipelothrix inopinata TaxID=225084 RepID=A0A7G9RZU4_9FIRM|nr:type II toxin-antitoxin system Phd/YefM family antitoxin [Erysipelothrix inopinata]QNN61119.1 hypothetical protein H9L01_01785 [Erysipelothrix inopinata]